MKLPKFKGNQKGKFMKKIITTIVLFAFVIGTNMSCGGETAAEKEKRQNDEYFTLLLLISLLSRSSSSSSTSSCYFAGTSGGCSSSAPYTCTASSFCSSSSSCSNLSACSTRSTTEGVAVASDSDELKSNDPLSLSEFLKIEKDATKAIPVTQTQENLIKK